MRKLGLRDGMRCLALEPPDHYRKLLVGLPEGVDFAPPAAESERLDFIHLFVRGAEGLGGRLRELRGRIVPHGMIWVSWPKKASGVPTDVTGDLVRSAGLAAGLVDVKVCAVDETWSGLKFVIRKADRG